MIVLMCPFITLCLHSYMILHKVNVHVISLELGKIFIVIIISIIQCSRDLRQCIENEGWCGLAPYLAVQINKLYFENGTHNFNSIL